MIKHKDRAKYNEVIYLTTKTPIKFTKIVSFRLKTDELKSLKKIIKLDPEKYYNKSHFIRCGVIRLLREETKRLIK